MADLRKLSPTKTPKVLTALLFLIVALGLAVAIIGAYSYFRGPVVAKSSELGTQGDFFGGHIAASVGMLTLAIVIYSTYRQSLHQERHFLRQYFIQGVDLIATSIRASDMLTALRLTEYYSRLAMSVDDDELYLILNTVLAGDIRKRLEFPDTSTLGNYPFATTAVVAIGDILKNSALRRKGVKAHQSER